MPSCRSATPTGPTFRTTTKQDKPSGHLLLCPSYSATKVRKKVSTVSDHEGYIASAAEALQPLLKQIRAQLSEALPEAQEVMKYNMPGFELRDSIVAGMGRSAGNAGYMWPPEPLKR